MRRILIFLLSLTIPTGFLIGAARATTPLQDDVTMEVEHICGDVSRVEGKQIRQLFSCGEHMKWETCYTAGEKDSLQTDFTFSQDAIAWEYDWDTENVMFSVDGGGGVITGDPAGLELADNGVGVLIQAVADRTDPGKTRTETVKLEDYLTCYPMDYNVNIDTPFYWIWESYDSFYEQSGFQEVSGWNERFRFPLLPGAEMEITVYKNSGGNVCDISYHMIDCPEIGFTTYVTDVGMYFAPFFLDGAGNPVTTGQYIYGNGVYYIPFMDTGNESYSYNSAEYEIVVHEGTFDFDNLRLVYGMEREDRIVAMEASEDGSVLNLLTMEDGTYYYTALDLGTGEVTYREKIMSPETVSTSEESYACYPEEEIMLLYAGKEMTVIRTGQNPGVEFSCTFPEDIYLNHPRSVLCENGQLFMAGIDRDAGFYLAVCDKNGLGYYGRYTNSLRNIPSNYTNYFVAEEELAFVKE